MLLAFYKVGNSLDYERYLFDPFNNPQKIKDMLCRLPDDELRIYDMDNKYDVKGFEDDYNNEILDNGWWCITIR